MSNPILNEKFTENVTVAEGATMTVNGTLQATAILGLLLLAGASFVWTRFSLKYTDMAQMLTIAGYLLGFIFAITISITKSKYLTPFYAVCEGLAIGGTSFIFEQAYPGIVSQAVGGTFVTLFVMLMLYSARIINCTDTFRSVVFISTVSIAGIYLINFIGQFFGYTVPFITIADSSPAGIFVTAAVAVIAALNLILDFDFIERGSQNMLPKDYEWYGAFGLMVTLVWLYFEILKLLSKLRRK